MENLKEKVVIRKEGKILTVLTYEEMVFLVDLTSTYTYEDIVEIEEKIPGFAKEFLLDEAQNNIYTKTTEKDIRTKLIHKRARDLYSKLAVLSGNDVFYIIQELFEIREVCIFELLDTFLKDVA